VALLTLNNSLWTSSVDHVRPDEPGDVGQGGEGEDESGGRQVERRVPPGGKIQVKQAVHQEETVMAVGGVPRSSRDGSRTPGCTEEKLEA